MRGLWPIGIASRELSRVPDFRGIAMHNLDPSNRVVMLDDVHEIPVSEIGHDDPTQIAEHSLCIQVREENAARAEQQLLCRAQATLLRHVA